jgi:signal peptidase I
MSKKKPAPTRRDAPAVSSASGNAEASHHVTRFVVFRETIESIVVAFVLAFLFRTFEAEAFVIPTGSMSPSLQGRHKDVHCDQCGYRFRISASSEDIEDALRRGIRMSFEDAEVVAGMCPMCRYPMPLSSDLPTTTAEEVSFVADLDRVTTQKSYPGDRILVNKYGYDFGEPQRWDVVVFKFPGDGEMNYIKRLVGLPGEELQVYQGDVFTRPLDEPTAPFKLQRKPPEQVADLLQTVHDTDYESATLHKAGWPLRWDATTPDGWNIVAEPGEKTVQLRFTVDGSPNAAPAWIRYRHLIPEETFDWAAAMNLARTGSLDALAAREGVDAAEVESFWRDSIRPQLITDFNAFNARLMRGQLKAGASWSMNAQPGYRGLESGYLGNNWVGDLAVEAEVDVEEARGELLLDLVEAGRHFRATINLESGEATLSIIDGRTGEPLPFSDKASTPFKGAGSYSVRFANVDDELLLWVDDELVEFQASAYDPDELFADAGGREQMIPWASPDQDADQGDLAPVGVGAVGAKLTVTRLVVQRDGYYIAADDSLASDMSMDYVSWVLNANHAGQEIPRLASGRDLMAQPETWARFLTRRHVTFPIEEGQLFVMGDNSPESADCRLWMRNDGVQGQPGGNYLDRRLLIGKAVCVFWPHSWGGIPGLPALPGFPNFGDMRLVR